MAKNKVKKISKPKAVKSSNTIKYNPNTGAKLKKGESVISKETGKKVTQGTQFKSSGSSSKSNKYYSYGTLPEVDRIIDATSKARSGDASSKSYLSGMGVTDVNKYISPSGTSNIDVNQPMEADALTTIPQYDLPKPEEQPQSLFTSILTGATGTVPTPTTESGIQTSAQQNLKDYFANLAKPPSLENINTKLEKQYDIKSKQQAVSNYQTQLNTIVNKAQADVLSTQGQGRGIPEVIIGGQQAQINKEAAIQALPIQALLESAQGDLELATSRVDKLFNIYAQDAENQVKFYNDQVKMVYDYATKQEQRQLDSLKEQKDFDRDILKSRISAQQDYASQALKDGNIRLFNALSSIQPPTNLNSASYKDDVIKYEKDVNATLGKYGQEPATGTRLLSNLPTSIQGKVISIAEKFGTTDIVKKFNSTVDSINVVNGIQTKSRNPADHQAIVYAFAKALDPDSAVKEGEYETIKKYAQSTASRYSKEITNAINGSGFLSEGAISNIKSTMNNLYVSRKPQYQNYYDEKARIINNIAGVEVAGELLTDYASGANKTVQESVEEEKIFDDVTSKPSGYWSKLWSSLLGN